jgi:transposase
MLEIGKRRARAVPVGIESEGDSVGGGFVIQDVGWDGGPHRMARPLSIDLRERVVAAVAAGESCRSVAVRFDVAVSSVVKWSQRQRATGSVAPGKMGGHRKRVLDPHRAFIVDRVGAVPHLTLHGLKDELATRGVKVSHNTVWEFLRREGLRFKKNTVCS